MNILKMHVLMVHYAVLMHGGNWKFGLFMMLFYC